MSSASHSTISGQFASRVEGFLKASGMAQSRFGRDVMGDPNFVRDMREGRGFNSETMDTVLGFIADWERKNKKLRVA
jgi:homoserine dehydrogenase